MAEIDVKLYGKFLEEKKKPTRRKVKTSKKSK